MNTLALIVFAITLCVAGYIAYCAGHDRVGSWLATAALSMFLAFALATLAG